MSKYATFDHGGLPIGFYDEEVHGSRLIGVFVPGEPIYAKPQSIPNEDGGFDFLPASIISEGEPVKVGEKENPDCGIPDAAVKITDEQWMEFLTYPSLRRWDGRAVVEHVPAAPAATVQDVMNERSRRLSEGFDFDFGDVHGVHRIGTTETDQKGWAEVTALANAMITTGNSEADIFISTDTGIAEITAMDWQYVLIKAGLVRSDIWKASAILQSGEIPADYADDKYWP